MPWYTKIFEQKEYARCQIGNNGSHESLYIDFHSSIFFCLIFKNITYTQSKNIPSKIICASYLAKIF